MARKRLHSSDPIIQCPVDLDSLIMSKDCIPSSIELDLNVSDDILYDAIRLSTTAYWLLKMDVLVQFTKGFRERLYHALPAFSRINRIYFLIQIEHTCHEELKKECSLYSLNEPTSTNLFNPLNMLGNSTKELDLKVLGGVITLREMLLGQIKALLNGSDRSCVDFSNSLFLPEMLNPKFFQYLTDAERLVLLGNLNLYFKSLEKFNRGGIGLRGSHKVGTELNPPQCLLKHVLGGDYSKRVKMMAWKLLMKEVERTLYPNGLKSPPGAFTKIFVVERCQEMFANIMEEKLRPQGYDYGTVAKWMLDANGLFEALELDCTLHNVDATDLILPIIASPEYFKMAEGLMDFQDDDTKERLFKVLASMMSDFR